MDILYRTSPPAYKGGVQPAPQRPGFLSGLGCYLFGGGARPAYRTVNGHRAPAAAAPARCFWQFGSATPAYKAAPALDTSESADPDPAAAAGAADPGCECPAESTAPSEDDPTEVYVWTD